MINKNKNQGFTLVELMITVAIIGIISAIAMPSYSKYVQKTKRTEAKTELLRLAQLQESYYVQNLSYAKYLNGTGGLGFSSQTMATETGMYNVQVYGLSSTGASGTCTGNSTTPCVGYRIEAIPASGKGQVNDSDCSGGLRIFNTGKKEAKSSSDTVWTVTATANTCWN